MNKNILLIVALAAVLLGGAGGAVYMKARGIRNNNPGNIRRGSSRWQGMSVQQTDPDFVKFDNPVMGIRALAKLLRNYESRYGLDTVRELITRWAPPNENVTESYVAHVASELGVDPDEQIAVTGRLPDLTRAIIKHENGVQPYTREQINEGIRRALT